MTKVDYTMTGCANGHPVRITGTGTATPRATRLRFAVGEAASTFDSTLAHLVGVDVLAATAERHLEPSDGPLVARCRVDLVGEGAVEVGTIVALATVERRRRRLACTVQLADAWVAMEVAERLTVIGERVVTIVSQANGAVLFSAMTVSKSRGSEWTAVASTLVVGCEVGERRTLTLPHTRLGSPLEAVDLGSQGRAR